MRSFLAKGNSLFITGASTKSAFGIPQNKEGGRRGRKIKNKWFNKSWFNLPFIVGWFFFIQMLLFMTSVEKK